MRFILCFAEILAEALDWLWFGPPAPQYARFIPPPAVQARLDLAAKERRERAAEREAMWDQAFKGERA